MKRLRVLCFLTLVIAAITVVSAEPLRSVIDTYHPQMRHGFIYVSKQEMTLTLADSCGQIIAVFPIACGKALGQKRKAGDFRTPEGAFTLQSVEKAWSWGHDFHDGKGYIHHAYGPFFLRLKTGHKGIGIHGTHVPQSIGTRATEGCIRLNNADLELLQTQVTVGMPVIIGPETP